MKEAQSAFQLAARALEFRNFVVLDEFGVNVAMFPRYGRSRAGQRIRVKRPLNKGRNRTFIGAISEQGGLRAFTVLPGSSTLTNFLEWVAKHLLPTLHPGQVVLMDNLRAHRNDQVRQLIESVGAHVLYTPPYSPEFNPIEECWSKIKNTVRKAMARTEDALLAATYAASKHVTLDDIGGWFKHASVYWRGAAQCS